MAHEQTHPHDSWNCPRSSERVLCFLYGSAAVCNAWTNVDPAWWSGRICRRVGLSANRDGLWLGRLETVTFEEVSTGLFAVACNIQERQALEFSGAEKRKTIKRFEIKFQLAGSGTMLETRKFFAIFSSAFCLSLLVTALGCSGQRSSTNATPTPAPQQQSKNSASPTKNKSPAPMG